MHAKGVRFITGNATLDGTERILIINAIGALALTIDAGSATRHPTRILRIGDAGVLALSIVRANGAHTIDGAASDKGIYVQGTTGFAIDLWSTAVGTWHTSNIVYEALVTLLTSTVPALTTRVTTLEAPANVDTTADLSPGYQWETAKLVHVTDNARSEGCSLVLDSAVTSTDDWPIHETREAAKYNTSVYGFGFVMGASDTLNGGSAGVGSGIIPGTTTVPSATVARPAVSVRRDGLTSWSWK